MDIFDIDWIKEFDEMCKPIMKYLKNNHNPHTTAVITSEQSKIVEDKLGIPYSKDLGENK